MPQRTVRIPCSGERARESQIRARIETLHRGQSSPARNGNRVLLLVVSRAGQTVKRACTDDVQAAALRLYPIIKLGRCMQKKTIQVGAGIQLEHLLAGQRTCGFLESG